DADNRLVQAHGRGPQGEFEAQYHYDALGRRSRKAVRYKGKTEQTTRFLWQGYRLLQEQRDDGSRRSWSYDPASLWSPLAALEQAGDSRSADIYWYHTDLNSAPLEVTDAAGNLCWSGQYDTFGKLQGQTVAGAAKRQGAQYQQPLRYAGQYQDDESGLHYNLFRYYEPEVGRFTTQDPIGLRGGLNLYQYAPNPLMWVDPLGLSNRPNNGKYHIFQENTIAPGNIYSSDAVQFNRANTEFIARMDADPSFRRDMLGRYPELGEWMKNPNKASSPPVLTWHHHEDVGRLVLVDRVDHADNHALYHPTGKGGREMWGGGEPGRRGKLDGATGNPKPSGARRRSKGGC
ncbi:type IV secretion protein Rhs, partial [Serratia marcescens]|uniref:RHS repeat-associated core domain-containing protein n=1 Tax=Serratia marcescens TaxID=615 RepID=UPI00110285F6